MKKYIVTTILAIFLIFSTYIFSIKIIAQTNSNSPGLEPYIPTKLEWLALTLNAYSEAKNMNEYNFVIYYLTEGDNTILIHVQYYVNNVHREMMNVNVEIARNRILREAQARGWDWVKIKEDYKKLYR